MLLALGSTLLTLSVVRDSVPWVLAGVGSFLAVLGMLVGALDRLEVDEDEFPQERVAEQKADLAAELGREWRRTHGWCAGDGDDAVYLGAGV